jgi:hypothetical protein
MSNLCARKTLSTANLINGMYKLPVLSLIFLLFSLGTSCQKEKKQTGILSEREMAALMVDIYLAEARITGALIPRDSGAGVFRPFEKKILEQRGVPDSILKKSYTYYLAHPAELEKIYDSVIDTLSLREQRLKKEEHRPNNNGLPDKKWNNDDVPEKKRSRLSNFR